MQAPTCHTSVILHADTVTLNFTDASARIALCGTVQFGGALHAAKAALKPHYADVSLPQARPLSAGEVLGCTSPNLQVWARRTRALAEQG